MKERSMKMTGSLIILFAACALSAADIVKDGKSLATILIPSCGSIWRK